MTVVALYQQLPATFTRENSDIGIVNATTRGRWALSERPAAGLRRRLRAPGSPSINNASVVGNAINPVTYQGIRVEALYKINEDWNVLLSQSYQDMERRASSTSSPMVRTARRCGRSKSRSSIPRTTRTSSRAPRGP